eukprot:7517955-Alexandrium_andersonii.AAC.1
MVVRSYPSGKCAELHTSRSAERAVRRAPRMDCLEQPTPKQGSVQNSRALRNPTRLYIPNYGVPGNAHVPNALHRARTSW